MYYYRNGQLDLSDRIAIETGICRGESFKKIARRIHRHPTTVSHEVKTNRTLIRGHYYLGKDCSHVRNCAKRNLCNSECKRRCCSCKEHDCRESHKPDRQRSAAAGKEMAGNARRGKQ